jgi:hypothetical protein
VKTVLEEGVHTGNQDEVLQAAPGCSWAPRWARLPRSCPIPPLLGQRIGFLRLEKLDEVTHIVL